MSAREEGLGGALREGARSGGTKPALARFPASKLNLLPVPYSPIADHYDDLYDIDLPNVFRDSPGLGILLGFLLLAWLFLVAAFGVALRLRRVIKEAENPAGRKDIAARKRTCCTPTAPALQGVTWVGASFALFVLFAGPFVVLATPETATPPLDQSWTWLPFMYYEQRPFGAGQILVVISAGLGLIGAIVSSVIDAKMSGVAGIGKHPYACCGCRIAK